MKKGAGSDPFGSGDDDAVDGQDGGTGDDVDDSSSRDDRSEDLDEGLESEPFTDDAAVEQAIETADDNELDLPQPGRDDSGVPWVYTRSNVKDSRDMVQFYLREAVQTAEDDFVDAVSDVLGTDVSKTDVREAAYVAAMRQPEIVAEELERWGFESE
ncbi:hypothetical protein Htur_4929 (plasmid) [Haloterrigena turkmenica DSM 5511]|uniref:Uncharacterized protein n=1 Tax=Haloterrigena turkmenica (strain ATCC 51198 / DSM 5511 / JCM 9101 / NCIMB 13204 / VKM B-1734 / 4k) TaxID=543526 RepID=D2S2R9_HALTV|nr:hypothetical protein [Haloterrigena turkmenica]ADB63666.1 hypothetical protein Htur_4929 [Haloterrigena turkmenica DSM 5511]